MIAMPVPPRTSRSRLLPQTPAAAVLVLATLGWFVAGGRMAGMDSGPGGDLGTFGWFAGAWAAMTTAMMLPAIAPVVLRLGRLWRSKAPLAGVLFAAGYASVWMLAGLLGYWLVESIRSLHIALLAWASGGRYVAGAVILAAGLYQFSPSKRRWLRRCAQPALRSPSAGLAGALRAGVEHGRCCVGCCWTLMVALYALGMMSLVWMALITVLIVAERQLPSRAVGARAVAAVLVALGIAVAAAPRDVPWLTVPGSTPPAMRMMGAVPMRPAQSPKPATGRTNSGTRVRIGG